MASTAQFTATARCDQLTISTANTNRDGSGTIGQTFLAGASGSRVERIRIKATGTTTAGLIRMYTYTGAAYVLFQEIAVSAITPSGTTAAFSADIFLGNSAPLFLPATKALGFSTQNAETFIVTTIGGDF